ncbi:MAG: ABC transporter substrate-binding protein [Chloroflexota bacterium]
MIDPTPNRERPMAGDPRSLDELAQARIDGHLTRRQLIRRATALGFAPPVIATLLHATSDLAFGAPAARAEGGPAPVSGPTNPPGAPQQGGVIIAGSTDEPASLNPFNVGWAVEFDVLGAIYEGLLGYDAQQTLRPILASSYSISPDGLSYTFTLQQGVTFHNGDPFTARDVIETWQAFVTPPTGGPDYPGWGMVKEMIDGGDTLTMTLKEVFAPFLSIVGPTWIMPASAFAAGLEAFLGPPGEDPVGTGPMKFTETVPGQRITLDRYDAYWGAPAQIDRLIFQIVPDDNTLLNLMQTGDIDLVGGGNTVPATLVDQAAGINGITVLQHRTMNWMHIDLKQYDFLRMTRVRQALDFATPTQDIVDKLLKGRAERAVADQAPVSWAWDGSIQPRSYDPAEAKRLLAEAGLTPGPSGILQGKIPTTDPQVGDGPVKPFAIELVHQAEESEHRKVCQVVADSWRALGIDVEVTAQPGDIMFDAAGFQFTRKMTGGFYEWGNRNDPANRLYWHSDHIPTSPDGPGTNVPAYFHRYSFQDEIDRLTDAGEREPDQQERTAIYSEIQRLLHEEVPVIFLYWPFWFPAVRDTIGGFHPNPFTSLAWNVNEWRITS